MRAWADGTLIVLDFSGADSSVGAPAAADVTQCVGCTVDAERSGNGVLAIRTKGDHGSGQHNGGVGLRVEGASALRVIASGANAPTPSDISCDAKMPPPPAPPPPPWCGLRPHYKVTKRSDDDHGRNGRENPLFEAEIAFDVWEAGALVDVEWQAPFRVVSAWFAKQTLYSPTSSSFELQVQVLAC